MFDLYGAIAPILINIFLKENASIFDAILLFKLIIYNIFLCASIYALFY